MRELLYISGNIINSNQLILKDVDLKLEYGCVYALFGKNGSGKSSLLKSILGVGNLKVDGQIEYLDEDISLKSIDERARLGIALVFQTPPAIKKLKLRTLLEMISDKQTGSPDVADFLDRDLNSGLSHGESKRTELAQVEAMQPDLLLIDELDSGVDSENLRLLADRLKVISAGKTMVLVSHSGAIFEYIKPSRAIVIANKTIAKVGSFEEIYKEIKINGYRNFK